MKKAGKYLMLFSLLLFSIVGNVTNIYSAGISVYASTSAVSVGDTFRVTVSASGVFVEGLSASCSGCTILSGISGTLDTGESKSLSVRLDSASGGSVSISGNAADYATETEYPVSGSAYVSALPSSNGGSDYTPGNNTTNQNGQANPGTDSEDDSKSKDDSLSSLTINEGKLTPEFSSDVTEYKVSLPADKTSITIDATANDSKASVSGTGKLDVKVGDNEFEIICTSEYGTSKTYKVIVSVDETPLIFTTYNSKKLGVVRNISSVKAPEGFEEAKVTLDGNEIPAWTNKKINKTIVYLSDEENNKGFYLFEDGKVTSSFVYKKILGREVYLIDIPEDKQAIKGMQYGELTIEKTNLMGWTFDNTEFENYSVIYVMDMDGEYRYYQYESTQKVLQLYSGAAPTTQAEFDSQLNMMKTIAIVASIVAVAGIGFAVYVLMKNKKVKKDTLNMPDSVEGHDENKEDQKDSKIA